MSKKKNMMLASAIVAVTTVGVIGIQKGIKKVKQLKQTNNDSLIDDLNLNQTDEEILNKDEYTEMPIDK